MRFSRSMCDEGVDVGRSERGRNKKAAATLASACRYLDSCRVQRRVGRLFAEMRDGGLRTDQFKLRSWAWR